MILTFDFSSDVPLYMQLRNQIVIGIAEGKLVPGEKLPTIRALADESGINMMTVSKAYQILQGMNRELKAKGYITLSGKCPTSYFKQKFYGLQLDEDYDQKVS